MIIMNNVKLVDIHSTDCQQTQFDKFALCVCITIFKYQHEPIDDSILHKIFDTIKIKYPSSSISMNKDYYGDLIVKFSYVAREYVKVSFSKHGIINIYYPLKPFTFCPH